MSRVYVPQEPMRFIRGKEIPERSLSSEAFEGRVTGAPTGNWVPIMDLSPAKSFGDMHILHPPGKVTVAPAVMARRMRAELARFSDEDFVLCVGPPVVMVATGIVAALQNNGRVKLLEWDKFSQTYREIVFDAYAG